MKTIHREPKLRRVGGEAAAVQIIVMVLEPPCEQPLSRLTTNLTISRVVKWVSISCGERVFFIRPSLVHPPSLSTLSSRQCRETVIGFNETYVIFTVRLKESSLPWKVN